MKHQSLVKMKKITKKNGLFRIYAFIIIFLAVKYLKPLIDNLFSRGASNSQRDKIFTLTEEDVFEVIKSMQKASEPLPADWEALKQVDPDLVDPEHFQAEWQELAKEEKKLKDLLEMEQGGDSNVGALAQAKINNNQPQISHQSEIDQLLSSSGVSRNFQARMAGFNPSQIDTSQNGPQRLIPDLAPNSAVPQSVVSQSTVWVFDWKLF